MAFEKFNENFISNKFYLLTQKIYSCLNMILSLGSEKGAGGTASVRTLTSFTCPSLSPTPSALIFWFMTMLNDAAVETNAIFLFWMNKLMLELEIELNIDEEFHMHAW